MKKIEVTEDKLKSWLKVLADADKTDQRKLGYIESEIKKLLEELKK